MPPVSSENSFPGFSVLSVSSLSVPGSVTAVVRRPFQIQQRRNRRDVAAVGNKSLAEYNLSLQPRIMELKSRVRQQLEEIEEQEGQIREKRDKLSGRFRQHSGGCSEYGFGAGQSCYSGAFSDRQDTTFLHCLLINNAHRLHRDSGTLRTLKYVACLVTLC